MLRNSSKVKYTDAIERIKKILPDLPLQATRSTAIIQLKIAKRNIKAVCSKAIEEKKDFLKELKARIASRKNFSNIEQLKVINMIDKQLYQNSLFCNTWCILKSMEYQTLNKIEIIKEEIQYDKSTNSNKYWDKDNKFFY